MKRWRRELCAQQFSRQLPALSRINVLGRRGARSVCRPVMQYRDRSSCTGLPLLPPWRGNGGRYTGLPPPIQWRGTGRRSTGAPPPTQSRGTVGMGGEGMARQAGRARASPPPSPSPIKGEGKKHLSRYLESVFQYGVLESQCLVMQENYPHLSDVIML
jgi:hypothetical protein